MHTVDTKIDKPGSYLVKNEDKRKKLQENHESSSLPFWHLKYN